MENTSLTEDNIMTEEMCANYKFQYNGVSPPKESATVAQVDVDKDMITHLNFSNESHSTGEISDVSQSYQCSSLKSDVDFDGMRGVLKIILMTYMEPEVMYHVLVSSKN